MTAAAITHEPIPGLPPRLTVEIAWVIFLPRRLRRQFGPARRWLWVVSAASRFTVTTPLLIPGPQARSVLISSAPAIAPFWLLGRPLFSGTARRPAPFIIPAAIPGPR